MNRAAARVATISACTSSSSARNAATCSSDTASAGPGAAAWGAPAINCCGTWNTVPSAYSSSRSMK